MRVPLEKEVPVTPVVEEPEPEAEEEEFPELTEVKKDTASLLVNCLVKQPEMIPVLDYGCTESYGVL